MYSTYIVKPRGGGGGCLPNYENEENRDSQSRIKIRIRIFSLFCYRVEGWEIVARGNTSRAGSPVSGQTGCFLFSTISDFCISVLNVRDYSCGWIPLGRDLYVHNIQPQDQRDINITACQIRKTILAK
jgi:hypothetical protein